MQPAVRTELWGLGSEAGRNVSTPMLTSFVGQGPNQSPRNSVARVAAIFAWLPVSINGRLRWKLANAHGAGLLQVTG